MSKTVGTILVQLIGVAILFLLSSCTHTLPLSTEGKAGMNSCMASCKQRANSCNATCRNSCIPCLTYSKLSAAEAYLYYQQEQIVKGGTIARRLKSYRDPLQCRKITCNCSADYQVCVQSCGGIIRKQLRVAPVCQ